MAIEMPAYGAEEFVLHRRAKDFELVRRVFVQQGHMDVWDQEALDYKSWAGSWQHVETLGRFETAERAREFMIARSESPVGEEGTHAR